MPLPELSLLRTEAALKAERLQLCIIIHGPGLVEDLTLAILDLIPEAGVEVHVVSRVDSISIGPAAPPTTPCVPPSELAAAT